MKEHAGTFKDRPLFSFVVLGDTHVNPDDRQTSSPWLTNRLANDRAAAVVAQINSLAPDFVVHLGDMVHPTPDRPQYAQAAERFWGIFASLEAPLYLVPGNHDIGDKPTQWTPAAPITEENLAIYNQHFGADHYAFEHRGCRFIVVNSEIFNSGLEEEAQHWAWLQDELAGSQRTFVFTHYPPFLQAADEVEHYDNLAEPARSRFLTMLAGNAEAVFSGHVHNFFYNRVSVIDFYVLPATSAVRHDYTELFSVSPGHEYGRDLRSKFGFFLVEIFETYHIPHFVHSWGECDARIAKKQTSRPVVSVRNASSAPIGVDLRLGWADVVSVPFSGAVDEFNRKRVRNDATVLALWEIGLKRLRVPLNDLVLPSYSERVEELGAVGHRFTAFTFGLPGETETRAISRHVAYLDGIEIIARMQDMKQVSAGAARLKDGISVPIFLSKLRVSAEAGGNTHRFAHFIRHGFKSGEADTEQVLSTCVGQALDGLAFAIEEGEEIQAALNAIATRVAERQMRAIIRVHLAGEDPAKPRCDDAAIELRVADAALAALRLGDRGLVFLDTFMDHDRGYFPRHGLVDRLMDLRPAGVLLRRIAELLYNARSDRYCPDDADGAIVLRASSGVPIALQARSGTVLPAAGFANNISAFTQSFPGVRVDNGAPISVVLKRHGCQLLVDCPEVPAGTDLAVTLTESR